MNRIAPIETGRTAANRRKSCRVQEKGRLDKISKLADFQSWVPKPHKNMRNVFVMLTFTFGIASMRNKSIDCDILASGLEIVQRVITFFEKKTNQTVSR